MKRTRLYVVTAISAAMLSGLAGAATFAQEAQQAGDAGERRPYHGMKQDGKREHGGHRFHAGHLKGAQFERAHFKSHRGMHGGMFGQFAGRHTEGMLAFAKAELGITEAQEPAWNNFAEAVRASAERMRNAREQARAERKAEREAAGETETRRERPNFAERMNRMERMAELRLQALREVNAGLQPLYAELTDEQRQKVEEFTRPRGHGRR